MCVHVCVCRQSTVLAFCVQMPFTCSPSLLDGDCSFKRRLVGSSFFSPDLIQTPISFICTDRCRNSLTSKQIWKLRTASSNSTCTCMMPEHDASFFLCPSLHLWVEQVWVSLPLEVFWKEMLHLQYWYDKCYVFNPHTLGWSVVTSQLEGHHFTMLNRTFVWACVSHIYHIPPNT